MDSKELAIQTITMLRFGNGVMVLDPDLESRAETAANQNDLLDLLELLIMNEYEVSEKKED